MPGIVYDTGALIAAERRSRRLWVLHDEALAAGITPIVPVVVLAQAWRGGPQAELSRLLKGCHIQADDEAIGRAAGVACAVAGTSDVVDAIVVVTALHHGAVMFTSDPEDLTYLADALSKKLTVHVVEGSQPQDR